MTLTNPLPEDFEFQHDKQWYKISAFKTVSMPAFLAVHGAKHLANKILIHKGKFADVFEDGKRKGGLSVNMGERNYIAKQMLNIKESELDLDEIIEESKNAPKKKDLEEGKPKAAITETPVGTVVVKGVEKKEEKKVDTRDPKDVTPDQARYEELKARWPKVNKDERAEYKQLRINLGLIK